MDFLIAAIAPHLLTAAAGLVTTAITWVGAETARLIRTKTKNEKAAHVIRVVTDVATGAVHEVEQSIRPTLASSYFDANGKLTKTGQAIMKREALHLVTQRLPKTVIKDARFAAADLSGFVTGKVEQAVSLQPRFITAVPGETKNP